MANLQRTVDSPQVQQLPPAPNLSMLTDLSKIIAKVNQELRNCKERVKLLVIYQKKKKNCARCALIRHCSDSMITVLHTCASERRNNCAYCFRPCLVNAAEKPNSPLQGPSSSSGRIVALSSLSVQVGSTIGHYYCLTPYDSSHTHRTRRGIKSRTH